jgi:hypothetical protein
MFQLYDISISDGRIQMAIRFESSCGSIREFEDSICRQESEIRFDSESCRLDGVPKDSALQLSIYRDDY